MSAAYPHYRDAPKGAPADAAMPANVELERALLGALLTRNEVFHTACAALSPEHFTHEINRRVFDVMASMVKQGRPAGAVTMASYFSREEIAPETWPGMTMQGYIAKLVAEAVTVSGAPAYAAELITLRGRRELIEAAEEARAAALDPPASASLDQLIDHAEAHLAAIRAGVPTIDITRGLAADFAADLVSSADDLRQGIAEHAVAPTTGIPDLDRDTGGFEPGTLWIVAGRPGMGKTIAATNLARAAAAGGQGALLFSLEVPRKQLAARVLSDLTFNATQPIPFGDILRGRFDDRAYDRLLRATERLKQMPLVLSCESRLTVSQIASRVRAEKLRMNRLGLRLGVVLIDYLKFVSATDRYAGQRHYEVGEISGALKALAKDEDLCVVLLAQLNRQVESRQDKRPDLADLRESGDLEADADVVAFIYRDAYYIERSPEFRRGDPDATTRALDAQHDLEIIVGKNRAGQARTHKLWVHVPCSLMSARDRGHA